MTFKASKNELEKNLNTDTSVLRILLALPIFLGLYHASSLRHDWCWACEGESLPEWPSLGSKGSELSRHKCPLLSIYTVNYINSKHLSQYEVVWSLLDLAIINVHFIARLTFLVQNDV